MISDGLPQHLIHPPLDNSCTARRLVEGAQRVIVKVGSSVAMDGPRVWADIVRDIHTLRCRGKHVVAVISGAVALGRRGSDGGQPQPRRRRAWASVGQMRLTAMTERYFREGGLEAAQVLIRHGDDTDLAATKRVAELLDDLCDDGIVPVVNEDDCNRDDNCHFTDNDHLAALVGNSWRADLIVFLTDIDAVYDGDPALVGQSRRIFRLDLAALTGTLPGGPSRSDRGTGGMSSKVQAARAALGYGCSSIIASGLVPNPLATAQQTGRCTVVCRENHVTRTSSS